MKCPMCGLEVKEGDLRCPRCLASLLQCNTCSGNRRLCLTQKNNSIARKY
jgi:hypothetical protein